MDDRTQEWLHRTRQLDRKHAIRGGVQRDVVTIRQTSASVVGALVVIAVLLIAPLRLADSPPPPMVAVGDAENRVLADPDSPANRAVRMVNAVLPAAGIPPFDPPPGIRIVPPHVPIWTSPRIGSDTQFSIPSELPPAQPGTTGTPNLVTR